MAARGGRAKGWRTSRNKQTSNTNDELISVNYLSNTDYIPGEILLLNIKKSYGNLSFYLNVPITDGYFLLTENYSHNKLPAYQQALLLSYYQHIDLLITK